jgi:LysM repeat protein
MIKFFLVIFLSVYSFAANAQRLTVEEYIEQFKDIAINEMKRSGVPASITLAQGILESENGNSELVKKSNNHFGIKCKSTWTGESVTHDDDANGECFRAYNNAGDSYKDHSDFLKANQRYASLFNLDPTDYAGWAKGLKKAGYATNPRYPDLLVKYIEQYGLQQYSLAALNKLPAGEEVAGATDAKISTEPDKIEEKKPGENGHGNLAADIEKVTSINNTKCVIVAKGTSLLVIANMYHISLSKLMEFNDMSEEGLLDRDQPIYLQKKSRTGGQEFYIVQREETMYDIAQKNAIQLKYLLEYNNFKTVSALSPGTKLFLQPGLKSTASITDDDKNKVHLVAPKEGLYAIAKTYNVTVDQLKEWNKLDSDNLRTGQAIIVSK